MACPERRIFFLRALEGGWALIRCASVRACVRASVRASAPPPPQATANPRVWTSSMTKTTSMTITMLDIYIIVLVRSRLGHHCWKSGSGCLDLWMAGSLAVRKSGHPDVLVRIRLGRLDG